MNEATRGPDDFDEAYYLRNNADVAEAIAAGHFRSAWEHFNLCGRKEGRRAASTRTGELAAEVARLAPAIVAGRLFAAEFPQQQRDAFTSDCSAASNPLAAFFDRRIEGRGIWKWRHYFEIYDRHLSRFRGQSPHVLEIGVYSGGSLDMWRSYFGPGTKIYGVDLEPGCVAYAGEDVKIYTGDQADRAFWAHFRKEVPTLDIVIDDGGHLFRQQAVTLEELLPHLQPGGVFVCEDIHGENHEFGSYVMGLANTLHAGTVKDDLENNERRLSSSANAFQSAVACISTYPMLVVIENNRAPVEEFVAAKHGTKWQPHLQ